jgi:hypothetical protein
MQLRSLLILVAVAGASALFTGCATITSGTSQTIAVTTAPVGADCQFTRDGKLVGRVNPTPGVMPVSKASGNIGVSCTKDGYEPTVGSVSSEFQAATFGNILLGGVIGVAVDAASGAMNKYPEQVSFTLVPVSFPSSAERDAFFDKMRDTFLVEYGEVVARINAVCRTDCDRQLSAAEASKKQKLAEIEAKRQSALVRSG